MIAATGASSSVTTIRRAIEGTSDEWISLARKHSNSGESSHALRLPTRSLPLRLAAQSRGKLDADRVRRGLERSRRACADVLLRCVRRRTLQSGTALFSTTDASWRAAPDGEARTRWRAALAAAIRQRRAIRHTPRRRL